MNRLCRATWTQLWKTEKSLAVLPGLLDCKHRHRNSRTISGRLHHSCLAIRLGSAASPLPTSPSLRASRSSSPEMRTLRTSRPTRVGRPDTLRRPRCNWCRSVQRGWVWPIRSQCRGGSRGAGAIPRSTGVSVCKHCL